MGYMIAFEWSKESEAEMKKMGFEKREFYVKYAPGGTTVESNEAGDAEFFGMKNPPYQFKTTSYWGMCNPD